MYGSCAPVPGATPGNVDEVEAVVVPVALTPPTAAAGGAPEPSVCPAGWTPTTSSAFFRPAAMTFRAAKGD